MNKSRFIERLNLYLDQELTEEEAGELLECARSNPEYQRLYTQYCQIFAACSQLKVDIGGKQERASMKHKVYAVGGMAAAVALLFLAAQNLSPLIGDSPAAQTAEVEQTESANAAPVEATAPSSFVAMDRIELESRRPNINEFQAASFDSDKSFGGSGRLLFRQSGDSARTRYEVDSNSGRSYGTAWQQQFTLDKPVAASTFEHERLSSEESARATVASSPLAGSRFEAAGATSAVSSVRRADLRLSDGNGGAAEGNVVVESASASSDR